MACRAFLLYVLMLAAVPVWAEDSAAADAELKEGIAAYKREEFKEAARRFRNATALAPRALEPRLYLATAMAQQYVPGLDTEENIHIGREAVVEFKRVLDLDPRHIPAMQGIAALLFQMKQFAESRQWHRDILKLDPNMVDSYYAIGVVDWTQAYQPRMERRARLGMKPEAPLIYHQACWELRDRNWTVVEDGIKALTRALELRNDHDDAMAYLNLMYRERADIQCGDRVAYQKDLDAADRWVELTMETKRRKAQAERPPKTAESEQGSPGPP